MNRSEMSIAQKLNFCASKALELQRELTGSEQAPSAELLTLMVGIRNCIFGFMSSSQDPSFRDVFTGLSGDFWEYVELRNHRGQTCSLYFAYEVWKRAKEIQSPSLAACAQRILAPRSLEVFNLLGACDSELRVEVGLALSGTARSNLAAFFIKDLNPEAVRDGLWLIEQDSEVSKVSLDVLIDAHRFALCLWLPEPTKTAIEKSKARLLELQSSIA